MNRGCKFGTWSPYTRVTLILIVHFNEIPFQVPRTLEKSYLRISGEVLQGFITLATHHSNDW